jgi:hypothetical protein
MCKEIKIINSCFIKFHAAVFVFFRKLRQFLSIRQSTTAGQNKNLLIELGFYWVGDQQRRNARFFYKQIFLLFFRMNFYLLLLVGILFIGSLLITNIISTNRLRKGLPIVDKLKDERYFELKYKIEYIITVALFLLGVTTIGGYNIWNSSQSEIQELNDSISSIQNKYTQINDAYINAIRKESLFTNAIRDNDSIHKAKVLDLENRYSALNSLYSSLNHDAVKKSSIYVVKDLIYKDANCQEQKYYFKNLISSENHPLPLFYRPPYILSLFGDHSSVISLRKITKDYFTISICQYQGEVQDKSESANIKFYVTILER